VTRKISARLAQLAKSLEAAGHDAGNVAQFLMRCLFTMLAEDIELLPRGAFHDLLHSIDDPAHFVPLAERLWQTMKMGGFSVQFRKRLLHFNGKLFADCSALPVTRDQLDLLIEAAGADWKDVEPAIFGTLLERALDPVERHKLGAHYTPRAYVERLVVPTVVEPLRKEWDAVRTAAITHAREGDRKAAVAELEAFHDRLCEVRVLDPACGSGNFLYVTLEHLKRLEGEVFATYETIAERQLRLAGGHTVDPHQLLGIEINPRAAAIAELVLWIGYLQWHFRTHGSVSPPEPVIKNFKNIECRDALLDWTSKQPLLDDHSKPVTRWDGRTTKPHPVTGEEVPDETARVLSFRYLNPKKTEWPKADFVVGNPPFIGNKRMRFALGDGYVDALRAAHDGVPGSVDYVMYWWNHAGTLARNSAIRRFGLITTNSITQTYSGRVVGDHLEGENHLSLVYAIPDHPWVDAELGAAVRISMSVVEKGDFPGTLGRVVDEVERGTEGVVRIDEQIGRISQQFRVGAYLSCAAPLQANDRLCWQGCKLVGKHFQVSPEKRRVFIKAHPECEAYLRSYWAGSDITKSHRLRYVIDLFGLEEDDARTKVPHLFQHLRDWVYPERAQNRDKTFREKWWLFGRPRPQLRCAAAGLRRVIATSEVAKYHTFFFLAWPENLVDGSVVAIALDDGYSLGVLSSTIHVSWAFAAGGRMGKGNDPRYQNGPCFDPFPFPDATDAQKARIRELGEQLDAHRKRQQELHPKLTMTGMYNVLERLRAGEMLTKKEQTIHEHGLVSVLRQIHDELDAAVADAYGWPVDLTEEEILERLVALNHARADEERRGIVRWLRPEFQNPDGLTQKAIATEAKAKPAETKKAKAKKQPWPKSLSAQAAAVQAVLTHLAAPAGESDVAKRFTRANQDRIAELLETLASLGKARQLDDGRYVAV
jgi:hypothetical protein